MIQKKRNTADEWHVIASETTEKAIKYITAHGLSEDMRKSIPGRRFGKVLCAFDENGGVRVISKSRSFEKRKTLERARARAAKMVFLS